LSQSLSNFLSLRISLNLGAESFNFLSFRIIHSFGRVPFTLTVQYFLNSCGKAPLFSPSLGTVSYKLLRQSPFNLLSLNTVVPQFLLQSPFNFLFFSISLNLEQSPFDSLSFTILILSTVFHKFLWQSPFNFLPLSISLIDRGSFPLVCAGRGIRPPFLLLTFPSPLFSSSAITTIFPSLRHYTCRHSNKLGDQDLAHNSTHPSL